MDYLYFVSISVVLQSMGKITTDSTVAILATV